MDAHAQTSVCRAVEYICRTAPPSPFLLGVREIVTRPEQERSLLV